MPRPSSLVPGSAGEYIRRQREEAGITLADFAEALGATPQAVSNIEHSRAFVPCWRLADIIEVLDLDADETKTLLTRFQVDYWGEPADKRQQKLDLGSER